MTEPRTYSTRPLPGRLEDIEWLADTDETLTGAATRLGITTQALTRWLRNHGHDDLLDRLMNRDADRPRGFRHLHVANPDAAAASFDDLLTSRDVCTYAGITYRQLDSWTRVGILDPYTQPTPGSGHARMYEHREADVALTMRHLLDASIDPRVAAQLARQLLAGETPRLGVFALVPIPGDLPPRDGDA